MQITGNGATAHVVQVNDEGQLSTISEIEVLAAHNAKFGRSFMISSGFSSASATADTTSAALYIKNTSTTKNLYLGITRTCGEVAFKWVMKTGATGMSTETLVTPLNMKLGDANTLDAIVYIGTQDATVTGGTQFMTWINSAGHSSPDYEGAVILGANQTMTLECIPFESVAGGSEACISIECWQD